MKRALNSSSVGISFRSGLQPCRTRKLARSSPQRFAAAFDGHGAFRRSRYIVPSTSRTCTSTSHPPRLYGRTLTLIAWTSSAMAHASHTLAGPPDGRGAGVRGRRWEGASHGGGGPPGPWGSCRAALQPLRTSEAVSRRCSPERRYCERYG